MQKEVFLGIIGYMVMILGVQKISLKKLKMKALYCFWLANQPENFKCFLLSIIWSKFYTLISHGTRGVR